ncbi:hypothetical protein [Streptomyces violaceoruber]|uniref:hypothetical protein n=1 Tax=Streptomyces violaceoruber TaxID=1935 RepID=UPI001F31DAB8|nr:hypothetical protein [Streptomyces violaceoruber]
MNWREARTWAASWEWGDAPAWAAFGLAAIALVFSIKAQKDGRRSADAAVASVKEARLSRVASEKSAAVAAETLADQRREAAERRAEEEEANRPRAVLTIEHSRKAVWQLINSGTAAAENVRCEERPEAMVRGWPDGLSIPAGEVHEFMMAGSMQASIPPVLRVTWDGQEEPVPLRVPPRVD